MAKYGKNYRLALEKLTQITDCTVEQALENALRSSYAKFDESVDVAMCLGVDPKYSDQMIRGAVALPHGLGKEVRIAVFAKGEKQTEARDAGADYVGAEDLVEKIKSGWTEFDQTLATPDVMALVGQVGRILGPRGAMPNAKTGTVTFDLANTIKEMKSGRVEFRVDKAGVLHAPLGRVSFGVEKILDNLRSFVDAVLRLKPASAKGTYIKTMAFSTTMGPGFKVEPLALKRYISG